MRKTLLFLLVLLIFILASCKQVPTEASFTSSCVFIQNPSNPNTSYTEVVSTPSYTCNADECIFWGGMNVQKSSSNPRVIFRTIGGYNENNFCIGYDFNNDGVLEGKIASSQISSTGAFNPSYLRSDGLGFKVTSDNKIEVGYKGSNRWRKTGTDSCDIESSIKPQFNCNAPEICDYPITYEAYFNFCPTENFPYCTGGDKNKVTTQGNILTTDWKISKNSVVNFDPKYSDNSPVEEKYIFIKKADCTCLNAINNGQSCDSSKLNCRKCPSGYTFYSGQVYCGGGSYSQDMCGDKSYRYDTNNCVTPFTSYQKCDGTKTIGTYGAQCNDWKTYATCPSGQYCYVDSTGQQGEGIGGCKCPTDPCKLGDIETNPDNIAQFRRCKQIGNCLNWGDWEICPIGLTFDSSLKYCICDKSKECTPNTQKCTSQTTYQKCDGITIRDTKFNADRNCYVESSGILCGSGSTCNLNTNLCDCSQSECKLGDIQCDSENSYYYCAIASGDTCPSHSSDTTQVLQGKICVNNQILDKSGIDCSQGGTKCPSGEICNEAVKTCYKGGCAYGTETCDVSIGKSCDTNQGSLTYNTCICKDDGTYCSGKEGQIKCVDSKSYQQCKSSTTSCPYWSSVTPISDAKICKNNLIQCPTSIDSDEWCDSIQAQTGATRCKHYPESVEKCKEYNSCYKWELEADCGQQKFVCVE